MEQRALLKVSSLKQSVNMEAVLMWLGMEIPCHLVPLSGVGLGRFIGFNPSNPKIAFHRYRLSRFVSRFSSEVGTHPPILPGLAWTCLYSLDASVPKRFQRAVLALFCAGYGAATPPNSEFMAGKICSF